MSHLRTGAARALLVILALPALSACGSLKMRDSDSLPETVGKSIVIVPVFLGVMIFEGFAADVAYRSERMATNRDLGNGEFEYLRELD